MDIIKYCFRHMCSKEAAYEIFSKYGVPFRKSDSYEKLSNRIDELEELPFDLQYLTATFREKWKPCPKEEHLKNLKSGDLKGHDWHGAMPSMLHLSMQNKVRDCIQGKLSLQELINIGSDIMKHEYFMVAAHDLLETAIIENFSTVIPPISNKSISDFVFDGVPYDLKNTNYIEGWDKERVQNNKREMAEKMMSNADVARLRKQAQKSLNGWGLNRFYVMVEDMDRWLTDPEGIMEEVTMEAKKLEEPILLEIDGLEIKAQVIAI